MSKFNSLLSDFGNTIGIPDLQADSSGICMLAFDDIEVVIQHIQDGDILLLYGYLGPIPPDNQASLFEFLLSANSFFRDTGGSTIGIDKITNAIGLHIAYPIVALDNQSFENLLENFVNLAESWIDKIDRFPAILSETSISPSPLQQNMNRGAVPPVSGAVPSTSGVPPSGGRPPLPPAGGKTVVPPPVSTSTRTNSAVPPPSSTGRPQGSVPPRPAGLSRPAGSPPPPPGIPPKR